MKILYEAMFAQTTPTINDVFICDLKPHHIQACVVELMSVSDTYSNGPQLMHVYPPTGLLTSRKTIATDFFLRQATAKLPQCLNISFHKEQQKILFFSEQWPRLSLQYNPSKQFHKLVFWMPRSCLFTGQ